MKEKITKSLISKSMPDCYLLNNFIDKDFSDQLIKEVLSLPLKRETIKMFGRDIEVPREIIWMSNPGISYRYSGIQHSPYPWSPNIKILHNLIIIYSNIKTYLSKILSSFCIQRCKLHICLVCKICDI